ncbi:hypothetical protein HSBAA_02360 [Vreelandella sulfidaeris]|uniref:Major facilitator superfamily (MFS) profile domain-containing protein n=1 Tax=Vreelandella sulfidaeris TaxID=115553 RepID=A0A455TZI3_9GAMM|nr:hypothetical protein HSBAA_02360 [Halomonas sulfidaeris]
MRKVSALLLASERRAISGLAGLYASRMLGLFMVLPVLALYADTLVGATPLLVGVALGIYGLTQATLQIPFGLLSDRIGRKRVIAMGLVIFALGSVVAALSDTIFGVIAGRALREGAPWPPLLWRCWRIRPVRKSVLVPWRPLVSLLACRLPLPWCWAHG